MSVTIETSPSLLRRLEDSVVETVKAVDGIEGIVVTPGIIDQDIETPYIVVNAARDSERIHNSGSYECTVSIHLMTTAGAGPKACTDAQLLALDGAIEEVLFKDSAQSLAATLTANADFLRVDAVLDIQSQATEFNDAKRNIEYNFRCICIAITE